MSKIGEKLSPAWENQGAIVSRYRQGIGHKTIAKEMGHSPRIVRMIIIDAGAWAPGSLEHRRGKSVLRDRIAAFAKARREIRSSHDALARAWTLKARRLHALKGRRATSAATAKLKYGTCPEYRLRCLLRRRIRKVITHGVKKGTSLELLGCTEKEFKVHIENLFELGMTWQNYGLWQLDHRKPCAAFNLTTEAGQKACFHYMNYRPMWREDNLAKSSMWKGRRLVRRG